MKTPEKKYGYDQQYAREKLRQFKFALNKETDKEEIEWLEKQKNKQGYIKELIRKDMNEKAGSIVTE